MRFDIRRRLGRSIRVRAIGIGVRIVIRVAPVWIVIRESEVASVQTAVAVVAPSAEVAASSMSASAEVTASSMSAAISPPVPAGRPKA